MKRALHLQLVLGMRTENEPVFLLDWDTTRVCWLNIWKNLCKKEEDKSLAFMQKGKVFTKTLKQHSTAQHQHQQNKAQYFVIQYTQIITQTTCQKLSYNKITTFVTL